MNSKWFAVAIVLAGASAACGEGRLIFNVDVYSWLSGSAKDTVPYAAPPLTPSFSASNSAQKINLVPGLGSSAIDTVKVTGTANVMNQSGGPGTLRFQVYLASDSAGTYTASQGQPVQSGAVGRSIPAGRPPGRCRHSRWRTCRPAVTRCSPNRRSGSGSRPRFRTPVQPSCRGRPCSRA